ncbi:hypothetical protein NHX12_022650 [Muraenolepis orangiensis]|uniref:Uncharacterized protein n=1 Tax=Muraenolepis orangiensis TaxID=630683 RepID=A0A9Q0IUJ2_9TELE|nr:hypothetical protein NHX12_022650 [Muraenolepis orangiensis]
MFGCWRTRLAPSSPGGRGEPYKFPKWSYSPSLATVLALWIGSLALGFVSGSGADDGQRGHNRVSHGNKRHHAVPSSAAHGLPASLRAGHSAAGPASPAPSTVLM